MPATCATTVLGEWIEAHGETLDEALKELRRKVREIAKKLGIDDYAYDDYVDALCMTWSWERG